MLQQTRVATVVPYYEDFIERFPDAATLARAHETEVLSAWAGLGYYSRARNLHKSAKIVALSGFTGDYAAIRALPGIGDYTAAAIASIAFDLPHAVVDGNVLRVLARLSSDDGDLASADTRARLRSIADALLDHKRPGEFNQALMELGATVCLPREAQCPLCPIARFCEARRRGVQASLPVKTRRTVPVHIQRELLVVRRKGKYLFWQRPPDSGRMAGFWELPEPSQLPNAVLTGELGRFRHTITHHHYSVVVQAAEVAEVPAAFRWIAACEFTHIPLSTLAKKALRHTGKR
jgi:A/G-specific adenine glycosylase